MLYPPPFHAKWSVVRMWMPMVLVLGRCSVPTGGTIMRHTSLFGLRQEQYRNSTGAQ